MNERSEARGASSDATAARDASWFVPFLRLIWIVDGDSADDAGRLDVALANGVTALWLRAPQMDGATLYRCARDLRRRTNDYGAALVIGDRADVALAVGAEAVQLGFRSPPLHRIRPWYPGPIGVSCHTTRDLERAAMGGANYAVLSPVFGVPEKGEPLGIPQFRRAVLESAVPVVGLGGIGPDEAPLVREAGAAGVAVIRALRDAPDIATSARALAGEIGEAERGRGLPPRRPRRDDGPVKPRDYRDPVPPCARLSVFTLAMLLAGGAIGGCQGVGLGPASAESKVDEDEDGADAPVLRPPPGPGAAARAETDPGSSYADDERFADLARSWPERVMAARERVPVLTGLSFAAGPPPRVVLTALGDDTIPFELRADIVRGRRRVAVAVNAEPHLAGVLDIDRTLLRALGTAALEDARARHEEAPAWVLEIAGMTAAADLESRLAAMHRAWALGRVEVIRVDPEDRSTAVATGVAAMLLIAARGAPTDVRRLLAFVADGDDAATVLGRIVGETGGGWSESARILLHARVRELDASPWRTLERVEKAYADAGPAGLEAALPERPPSAIAEELVLVRARAAIDGGQLDLGRSLLRALPADALARVRDPAEAQALAIEAELGAGGDRERAIQMLARMRRDFPRSRATERLVRAEPTLGLQEDPRAWMRETRARIAAEGTSSLDIATAARFAQVLLLDHRAGAAERFLAGLGRRVTAPELHAVARAVAEAQEDPSPAATAMAADRFESWRDDPTDERRRDLLDGGLATSAMIVDLVRRHPEVRGEERHAVLLLAAEAAGDERALRALEPVWRDDPPRLLEDLPALTSATSFDALDAALRPDGLAGRLGIASEEAWRTVAGGLDVGWLRDHPGFLAAIRSSAWHDRRRAFEALLDDPGIGVPVAWLEEIARDPAPRLRQRAVEQAAAQGHLSLVESALDDPQPSVRAAAARGLGSLGGSAARNWLLEHLEAESDPEALSVTAFALLRAAPEDREVLARLLTLLRRSDAALRDPLAVALGEAPRAPLASALVEAIAAENARASPERAHLFRLMAIWQRATAIDLGWHPGSTKEETAAMVHRMRRLLAGAGAIGSGSQ